MSGVKAWRFVCLNVKLLEPVCLHFSWSLLAVRKSWTRAEYKNSLAQSIPKHWGVGTQVQVQPPLLLCVIDFTIVLLLA